MIVTCVYVHLQDYETYRDYRQFIRFSALVRFCIENNLTIEPLAHLYYKAPDHELRRIGFRLPDSCEPSAPLLHYVLAALSLTATAYLEIYHEAERIQADT
jgi:hypothetical protein